MNSKNKQIKIRLAVIILLLICLLSLSSCGEFTGVPNLNEEDKKNMMEYVQQLPDEGCCG